MVYCVLWYCGKGENMDPKVIFLPKEYVQKAASFSLDIGRYICPLTYRTQSFIKEAEQAYFDCINLELILKCENTFLVIILT